MYKLLSDEFLDMEKTKNCSFLKAEKKEQAKAIYLSAFFSFSFSLSSKCS
jgi:hypothetical protein